MSRRRNPQTLLIAAAARSILLPGLVSGQQATPPTGDKSQGEVAPQGQRATIRQIKYGDWQKFCFKTPGSNQVCRTTISGNFDTGQSAVRADLIEREGEGKRDEDAVHGCPLPN